MQININSKVATVVGCLVGISAIGTGAVAMFNNNEAEKAKEAAALAYANRPIVENDCVMNGRGAGSCSFTNVGKTEGAVCGRISVYGPGTHVGSKFCSGIVPPMSTVKVEFVEPIVSDMCEPKRYDQSWTDVCNFQFVKDGLGGGDTEAA